MLLLRENGVAPNEGDLSLRMIFCEFLATCTYATMARAEDMIEEHVCIFGSARCPLVDDN